MWDFAFRTSDHLNIRFKNQKSCTATFRISERNKNMIILRLYIRCKLSNHLSMFASSFQFDQIKPQFRVSYTYRKKTCFNLKFRYKSRIGISRHRSFSSTNFLLKEPYLKKIKNLHIDSLQYIFKLRCWKWFMQKIPWMKHLNVSYIVTIFIYI